MLLEKKLYLIERNNVHTVIQIRMHSTGNNHQLLVITFQFLESIFAEIPGMSFLSMDKQYGATNFITISKDWCIDESKCRSLVPPQTGVNGTGMIASFRFVIIVIIFLEFNL